jgi:outer membrane immunogenic protein
MGCFVVGIEADFSGSGMSGSSSLSPVPPYPGNAYSGGIFTTQENINYFGTVRPRLGYTVRPNVLVYATGGLAYGNVSYSANSNYIPGGLGTEQYPVSLSTTKVGWALGGGVEYALSKCWTVKVEYMYMDLGSESVIANPTLYNPPYQTGYNWQTTANIFQVGMNYKF